MKLKVLIIITIVTCGFHLYSSDFDIKKFSDPEKYGWDSPEILFEARADLYNRQKLLQIYELKNQSITTNLIKSAFAPGWGHFSSGEYTKGQILLGLELIFLGTSYYYHDSAMEKYNKYKKATYITDINQFYEDANDSYFISQIFFSLGAIVWIYTIYDSINSTETYNDKVWNEIRQQHYSKGISINPTGFTWRF
jgi:hypothetical protein